MLLSRFWYVLLALVTDGAYAIFASTMRRFLDRRWMQGPLPGYASGSVFIGLGLGLAFDNRRG